MTRWLVMMALSPLLAAPAIAGPVRASAALERQSLTREAASHFRLLTQPPIEQLPGHRGDLGPETAVSTNSTLGFAMIRASSRMPDDRLYGRISRPRSAAVKFRLKF